MLILKTIKRLGPTHGYGIAKSIQQTSDDVLRVEEGSLYPALQRILKKDWVTAEWVQAGPKRRSRIYHLTLEGRKQLCRRDLRIPAGVAGNRAGDPARINIRSGDGLVWPDSPQYCGSLPPRQF